MSTAEKANKTLAFTENDVSALDLADDENFASLIVEYLCAKKLDRESLDAETRIIIQKYKSNIRKEKINFEQFNELLLLLNQDRISESFFEYFFCEKEIDLDMLINGVIRFRGFAMLYYGNFRFAYKQLSKMNLEEIEKNFQSICKVSNITHKRPNKILDIQKIDKEDTWYLGYISGAQIKKEIDLLPCFPDESDIWSILERMQKEIVDTRYIGKRNTDVYLTWDYIDIYVATSMRNKWEFGDIYDFIAALEAKQTIKRLSLRFFDPTQSFCDNPKDKGLIEGLMLKRALITIYMAQESDTMGKDSELAATLAQGKPVIAFVPKYNAVEYAKKIFSYPLDYFKKRIMFFKAEELFEDEKFEKLISKKFPDFQDILENFLKTYNNYRSTQPFTLWTEKEKQFISTLGNFKKVVDILAIAECFHFDKRAETLRKNHPLAMQVDIHTGIANGVLVIRNIKDCGRLIDKLLKNKLKFQIIHEKEGYYSLVEEISKSCFRVITDYEKLKNSFWNFFTK